ncbi:MAG TPA: efflux RND transporter periplasmic adaptor subunit [Gemmatimonadaceae bacterium]|nr:efflux RND transporter periplasmic adaptor subunit [Gemmatimonadaceae bacterium]
MLRLFRSRWTLFAAITVIVAVVGVVAAKRNAGADEANLTARAARGDFRVMVTVAGDLRAKSSITIPLPNNVDRIGGGQLKISSIVPEGTVVKSGDVVAELDRSPLMTQVNNYNLSLARAQAVFEQAQLDTTLNLSKAREDLRTMEVALEERRIGKEQAAFEAPSVKRQAEIDYEKADRALKQGRVDYVTRGEQAKAKMREVSTDLDRNKMWLTMVQDVMQNFTVRAPSPGMVIYVRDYSGKKKGTGSTISPWDGVGVATLPDLTKMESMTYVNEIDVRRVAVGQPVAISLDSDPSKKLNGKVVAVANVGEERPNSDAKVFEVKIEVVESDTTLRPGMTTSNAIETMALKDVLSVPLEAITSYDNIPYVFKRNGGGVVKQEVETGEMNDSHVVIKRGLSDGDEVLLIPPRDAATLTAERLTGAASPPAGADAPATKSVPVKPDSATKKAPTTPSAAKSGGR